MGQKVLTKLDWVVFGDRMYFDSTIEDPLFVSGTAFERLVVMIPTDYQGDEKKLKEFMKSAKESIIVQEENIQVWT